MEHDLLEHELNFMEHEMGGWCLQIQIVWELGSDENEPWEEGRSINKMYYHTTSSVDVLLIRASNIFLNHPTISKYYKMSNSDKYQ